MQFPIETVVSHKIHIQVTVFSLALLGFILSIVRLALLGSIPIRMNIWVLIVVRFPASCQQPQPVIQLR